MAPELLGRGIAELRDHMFVEEELVFPAVDGKFAAAAAELAEDHGRISDLAETLRETVRRGEDPARIRRGVERLLGLLAAHGAAEDLGLYAELPRILGAPSLVALLAASEQATAPADWVCLARRVSSNALSGSRPGDG